MKINEKTTLNGIKKLLTLYSNNLIGKDFIKLYIKLPHNNEYKLFNDEYMHSFDKEFKMKKYNKKGIDIITFLSELKLKEIYYKIQYYPQLFNLPL